MNVRFVSAFANLTEGLTKLSLLQCTCSILPTAEEVSEAPQDLPPQATMARRLLLQLSVFANSSDNIL